ncbi:MAG: hypothetical protein ACRCT6_07360, partial [Notoacmeibacter sp.]
GLNQKTNPNPVPNPVSSPIQGEPMYYPYPAAQFGMMSGNGMMLAPVQQPAMMPQMMMPQPVYGHPMMPQQMMPQMMAPQMMPQYAFTQPMMQQPMMQQPVMQQPVVQPVYVAMPQHSVPNTAPAQFAETAPQAAALPNENDYSEIRGRLQALRNGILNLADGRDRLAKLG